ncbi:unnamed protein product [Anisakis simplex]|uniref:Uncharacterized protein n=1 Tax=Anisakis simplex TaxID=6269 RepID=A0A3P6PU53_ANISI|nr:unnamed protein product [Anisakis simplex]
MPPDNDRLSVLLSSLDPLWELVSACLQRLAKSDAHAALALQPAAEAFFLVHGHTLSGIDPSKYTQHPDAVKLVQFAGKISFIVYYSFVHFIGESSQFISDIGTPLG